METALVCFLQLASPEKWVIILHASGWIRNPQFLNLTSNLQDIRIWLSSPCKLQVCPKISHVHELARLQYLKCILRIFLARSSGLLPSLPKLLKSPVVYKCLEQEITWEIIEERRSVHGKWEKRAAVEVPEMVAGWPVEGGNSSHGWEQTAGIAGSSCRNPQNSPWKALDFSRPIEYLNFFFLLFKERQL